MASCNSLGLIYITVFVWASMHKFHIHWSQINSMNDLPKKIRRQNITRREILTAKKIIIRRQNITRREIKYWRPKKIKKKKIRRQNITRREILTAKKKKAKKKFGKKKFPSAMTLMSHYSIHDLKSKTRNRPSLLTSRRCLMTSPWRRAANENEVFKSRLTSRNSTIMMLDKAE